MAIGEVALEEVAIEEVAIMKEEVEEVGVPKTMEIITDMQVCTKRPYEPCNISLSLLSKYVFNLSDILFNNEQYNTHFLVKLAVW